MKAKHLAFALFLLVLVMSSTVALANDQVVSTATNLSGPPAVIGPKIGTFE